MRAEQIHAKIYAGRGKAALRLGLAYRVLRPTGAADPLDSAGEMAVINAAFNAGDNDYRKPAKPGEAVWYGDFDGRQTRPGDYLVPASGLGQTYFIAAQQPLLPIVCIACDRAVRVSRAAPPQGGAEAVGAVGYSGLCEAPGASVDVLGASTGGVFTGWPCSILFGGRAQPASGLPADVKNAGWRLLLPPSVPLVLRAGDILTDDLGRRFAIEGAELSATGWRLNAQEAHT